MNSEMAIVKTKQKKSPVLVYMHLTTQSQYTEVHQVGAVVYVRTIIELDRTPLIIGYTNSI